jgi:hypothetical protein
MSNKAIPLFVIAAGASFALQPTRPGRTDAVEALQARVTALEARVAILERRHPDRRRAHHPPIGDLEGLPRRVVDAIAWAHPGAEVSDADLEEDIIRHTAAWQVELTADHVDWVMAITPDGRIIDDRVDD